MPIIKKYDISKIDEVKRISSLVKETQEDNRYNEYTPDDIMLIRITNVFPFNGEIKPLASTCCVEKSQMNFICNALSRKLDYNILEQLETYEPYYRSTVHFTLNGLVTSHMYGNFSNQNFIILEPLSEQLNKAEFGNFCGQDTFIKGSMTLSEKAIIIIKDEVYADIRELYPEIENYNVILYKGIDEKVKEEYIKENEYNIPEYDVNDERAIVEIVLMDLGYTPEIIGTHYIINSPTSGKIRNVNEFLAEKYNVLAEEKHINTNEHQDDLNKTFMLRKIFDKMLLDFILKINNIEQNFVLDENTAIKIIELIGIDNIIESINKFNETIEKLKQQDLLPTCEQLLNGTSVNLFDYYNNSFSNIK